MKSTKDQNKAEAERQLFGQFAKAMSWPVEPDLIKSLEPPRPDILYSGLEILVAFELAEICAPDIAQQVAQLKAKGGVNVIWTFDPTEKILLSKLQNNYVSAHPIALLCCLNNRVVSPDSTVNEQIATTVKETSKVDFRRIWYFGERQISEFSPVGELTNTTQL